MHSASSCAIGAGTSFKRNFSGIVWEDKEEKAKIMWWG
jgi:hypothetical protein